MKHRTVRSVPTKTLLILCQERDPFDYQPHSLSVQFRMLNHSSNDMSTSVIQDTPVLFPTFIEMHNPVFFSETSLFQIR